MTYALLLLMVLATCAGCALVISRSMAGKSGTSILMRIFINFMQMVSILGLYRVRGPALFRDIMGFAEVGNGLSLDVMPVRCAVTMKYFTKLIGYMVLPVVIALAPAVALGLHRAYQMVRGSHLGSMEDTVTMYKVSVVVLLFLVHGRVSKEVFTAFHCYESPLPLGPGGAVETRLLADLGLSCHAASHTALAVFGLVAYTLGIPALALAILWSNRHRLLDANFKQMFGFVYGKPTTNGVHAWGV